MTHERLERRMEAAEEREERRAKHARHQPEITCTTCGVPVGRLIPNIGPRHLDGIPYPFMYHAPTRPEGGPS